MLLLCKLIAADIVLTGLLVSVVIALLRPRNPRKV